VRARCLPVVRQAFLSLGWLLSAACIAQPATVTRAADTITFNGRIDGQSAATFLQLLAEPGVTRVVITSNGGLVAPALDIADAIHARALDVAVPWVCLSSCANYIFPAARRKTIGRAGAVGWHGNITHIVYLEQSGQGQWSAALMQEARALARREAEFYRRIGVDGFACWFGKLPPYNVEEFYALSLEDMAGFGIRDVGVSGEARGPAYDADVRAVKVDWASLEAARPAVRLDE
jgi:hypothetical protein